MSKRPFVVCYICGREFGSASIGIHEEQCLKKWHQQNDLRPKNERLPPPVKPQSSGTDGYVISNDQGNTKYASTFNEAAAMAASGNLVPCPICKRTFNSDRIDIHKRVCKPSNMNRLHPMANNSHSNTNNTTKTTTPTTAKTAIQFDSAKFPDPCLELSSTKRSSLLTKPTGPTMVICYICGRQFGTKSLVIHEPQCMAKWESENQRLPSELRRPKPVKLDSNPNNSESYNQKAWKTAQQNQLVACSNCSRRFLPDRLPIHMNACLKHTKSNLKSDQPKSQPVLKPRTVVCYICGREYGTASISIHEPKCLEKWNLQNDQLPPSMRRKCPEKPQALPGQLGSRQLVEYNELATEHSNAALVPCSKCGRTFNPDRVMIHERVCKVK